MRFCWCATGVGDQWFAGRARAGSAPAGRPAPEAGACPGPRGRWDWPGLPAAAAGSAAVVELGHQPPVGFPGGGEFLVAFFECLAQVEDLLAQAVGLFAEGGCIVGGAEPGALADLGAEQFGQALFESAGVVFQAAVAFAQVGVVGQQRAAAGGAGPGGAAGGWVFGGGDDRGAQVGVAVDEGPVHPGAGGDRGDGDLGGLGAHLGEGLADPLAAAVHVAAAGLGQRVAGGHGRVIRWRAGRMAGMPSMTVWRAARMVATAFWMQAWSASLRASRSASIRRISSRTWLICSSGGAAWARAQGWRSRGVQAFPVGQQLLQVGLQLGQVGRVAAEVPAAGADVFVGAGAAAGLDVRRLGAHPERDGDLPDADPGLLVGEQAGDVVEDPPPGGVELVAGDPVDRGADPVLGDPVVAGGGAHGPVRHQLAQHVGPDPGVGVPLGVAVPVGVRHYQRRVDLLAVGVGQQVRDGVGEDPVGVTVGAAEDGLGAVPVALVAGEQHQVARGGAG